MFIREILFFPLMGGVHCREGPLIEVPLYLYIVDAREGRVLSLDPYA